MKTALLLVMLTLPMMIGGQEFPSVVDFNLELSTLSNPNDVEEAVQDGRLAILEGLMGDTLIAELDGEPVVWVTLVGGSWVGTDEVRSYSCRILFRGESWTEVFPAERPREPTESYIPPGSRLLVVSRILGFDEDLGSAVAEMVDYRVLE